MIAPSINLVNLQQTAEAWTPHQTLRWAFDSYSPDVSIASAFGPEGLVVIDIAARLWTHLRVFTLDTDYLFPQTLALMAKVESRYRIEIERIRSPITPDDQARAYGSELWSRNPDLCCQVRKIEPLKNKLAQLRAWVTAIRRDQTPARATAGRIQWDNRFKLVKVNPLVDWTSEMVWNYIRTHKLDYNPLHDSHYPSIGCQPCTRPVLSGEAPRSGRWTGFAKSECGLHFPLLPRG